MRFGIFPSSSRSKDDLLEIAELSQRKFFDSIWLDFGPNNLAASIGLAHQCRKKTREIYYGVFYYPQQGDNLREIAETLITFQTGMKGYGFLVISTLPTKTIDHQHNVAEDIAKTLLPLLQGKTVTYDGKMFQLVNEQVSMSSSPKVYTYLDSHNQPGLFEAAGQWYQGVLTRSTKYYFRTIYEQIVSGAQITGNDISQFDFVVSLPTYFGQNPVPDVVKQKLVKILNTSPPMFEKTPTLPISIDTLTPEQITELTWSGSIYDVNERILDYYHAFGDPGTPSGRLPFHMVVEEPFGDDTKDALILVADESGFNFRMQFDCEFERSLRLKKKVLKFWI